MPDFSDPKYASYVQLCRELRLDREFREGDWWITVHAEPVAWTAPDHQPIHVSNPNLCNDDGGNFPGFQDDHQFYVWLPALGDWLEMLEEAGWQNVGIYHPGWLEHWVIHPIGELETLVGSGSTREEAAARLWMAVRQEASV